MNDVRSRRAGLELFQLLADCVQAVDDPAVVDLVMALDQTWGNAIQRPGAAVQWGKEVAHGITPGLLDAGDEAKGARCSSRARSVPQAGYRPGRRRTRSHGTRRG